MDLIGNFTILFLLVISFGVTSAFAVVLGPVDSLHFDNSDDANFVIKGNSLITSQENPSLKLDGIGDYLILDSNLPAKINAFSVSVWIKPDYKIGIPSTLSIVSETNAFDLSINNDHIDKKIVTFSIYDGIKWHHVDSKSEIKDTWTHIAATYSDEGISIFVNGVKENSAKVDGDYSQTHSTGGVITRHSFDYISSKSNVLVGAFTPLLRADSVVKNNFSGLIDDVGLYTSSLSSENVSELYNKNRIFTINTPLIQKPILQETGISNEFGFVSSKNDLNDQKIESLAFQGYKISKQAGGILNEIDYSEISNDGNSDSTTAEYFTPEKPKHEKTVSVGSSIKKLVRAESGSAIVISELPTNNSGVSYTWKLYGFENGQLVDHSNNPDVYFHMWDSDSDGTLDRAEWVVINSIRDFYLISEIL